MSHLVIRIFLGLIVSSSISMVFGNENTTLQAENCLLTKVHKTEETITIEFTGTKGPTFEAFQAGWNDGKKAATKDHPEKAAEMLGIPLEDYLRALRETEK